MYDAMRYAQLRMNSRNVCKLCLAARIAALPPHAIELLQLELLVHSVERHDTVLVDGSAEREVEAGHLLRPAGKLQ